MLITALLAFFLLFVLADAALVIAVLYHLRKYSLPGWTAAKIIVPLHLAASLLFLGFATRALLAIRGL